LPDSVYATMKHCITLFASLLFLTTVAFAQKPEKCGVVKYHELLFQKYPQLRKAYNTFEQQVTDKVAAQKAWSAGLRTAGVTTPDTTTLRTIPIVVHVIHNNANNAIGGYNIPDAQILSQIPILNRDYRRRNADTVNTPSWFKPVASDMNFEFCMASVDPNGNPTNGITRTYNSTAAWSINQDAEFKSLSYWPSSQYLNIWVINLEDGILGYSQLPYGSLPGINSTDPGAATDGIVILYAAYGDTIGVNFPYALGRTVTHEIGHWLGGLRHPWGDGPCYTDYIDDTPWQDSADYDYDPCSFRTSSCNGPKDTLMTQNYMQYTGDNCMNMFTNDQKQRSRVALFNCPRRVALLNSNGCGQARLSATVSPTTSPKFTIYPNPASTSFSVSYNLSNIANIQLSVYNMEGILVQTLINTTQTQGEYNYTYTTEGLPSGLYLFRFASGDNAEMQKVIIVK